MWLHLATYPPSSSWIRNVSFYLWISHGLHGVLTPPPPPSGAYMRQWIGSALDQIMACHLFGAKPWSKPMLDCCQLNPYGQTSVKFNQTAKLFIHLNSFENIVCEMAAILSRGTWVILPTIDCFANSFFRQSRKDYQSLVLLAFCEGNRPVAGVFPAQRASDTQFASMS